MSVMDITVGSMKLLRRALWACVALLALAGCGDGGEIPPAPPSVPAEAQAATIDSVVDGDTIWVIAESPGPLTEGERHKVRLLEIDAPELYGAGGRPECGARESREFLRTRLYEGSTVHLVSDRTERDRYDRALRYIWDAKGRFINRILVREGHARAVLFEPNDHFINTIRQAESEARVSKAGLWETC